MKVTKSTAVTELGLPTIIWRLLWRQGIFTVADLVQHSAGELERLSYVRGRTNYRILGPTRMAWLVGILGGYGFELARDARPQD